jgi:polyphosphate kinase 2
MASSKKSHPSGSRRRHDDGEPGAVPTVLDRKGYEQELLRLQGELVAMQEWIRRTGTRLVVLFEGRDTAGKGGVIQRIVSPLNPRTCRVVALPAPTERERTQWYFQRYVAHLPAAGEMVLFDRSWYNRAGVERVMGFCSQQEYEEFAATVPILEHALLADGIVLVKYWLSVSDGEQRRRFQSRIDTPAKRWKLSPMDLEAQSRWVDYAEAKDAMFRFSDTPDSPWWVVDAEDKKVARLNVMAHLLSLLPYEHPQLEPIKLPRRQDRPYVRPPMASQTFVPQRYARKTGATAS